MAFSKEDLDRIDAAIASGELLVMHDQSKIRYRNMGELLSARRLIFNTLRRAAGHPVPCANVCRVFPTRNI